MLVFLRGEGSISIPSRAPTPADPARYVARRQADRSFGAPIRATRHIEGQAVQLRTPGSVAFIEATSFTEFGFNLPSRFFAVPFADGLVDRRPPQAGPRR